MELWKRHRKRRQLEKDFVKMAVPVLSETMQGAIRGAATGAVSAVSGVDTSRQPATAYNRPSSPLAFLSDLAQAPAPLVFLPQVSFYILLIYLRAF